MSPHGVASLRLQLSDAGFRPVACKTNDKMPVTPEWQLRAQRDPPADAVEPPDVATLNTGILCSGLRVLDFDVDSQRLMGLVRPLALRILGVAPYRMRPDSPRCAIPYRAASGAPGHRIITGTEGKIEVLGHGAQLLSFGIHPDGAELYWHPRAPGEIRLEDLPVVTEEQISEFLDAAAPLIGAPRERRRPTSTWSNDNRTANTEPSTPIEWIASALAAIPNDGPPDWVAWNTMLMAVWRATGGSTEGLAAVRVWSALNACHSDRELDQRWRHFRTSPPTLTGATAIFRRAREHGWQQPGAAEPPPAFLDDPAYLAALDAAADAGAGTVDPRAPRPRLLGPYYAPPIEPRDEALLRMRGIIGTMIAETALIGGARRLWHERRDAAFAAAPDATRGEKAAISRRIHREVAQSYGWKKRIPKAQRLLLSGSQGVGKTRDALNAVVRIRENVVNWHLSPTLDKSAENLAAYRVLAGEGSMPAMLVRGRGAPDPQHDGQRMCVRHEVTLRAAKLGIPPRKAICPRCPRCPRAGNCAYLQQEEVIETLGIPALFFCSHNYLTLPCPAPKPDVMIVDEGVTLGAAEVSEVPIDELRADLVPYAGHDLGAVIAAQETLAALREALQTARPLAALRAAGVDRKKLQEVRRRLDAEAERRRDATKIDGGLTDVEIERRLDRLDEPALWHTLGVLAAVLREIDQPRDVLNAVTFDAKAGKLAISRLQPAIGLKTAGILALDGTGDIELNRQLFGAGMAHEEVRVDRDTTVIGTSGRQDSRQSITGADRDGKPLPDREVAARRLRDEVGAIARRLPGPTLVAASMQAEEALVEGGHLAADAMTAHFGSLRGKNAWEECPSVLVLGREAVSIEALEGVARAFLADDPVPLVSMAGPAPADWPFHPWPYVSTRARRMRDGSFDYVEVPVHPDPRVQLVLEQIREAELIQAVDRTRPVFNYREIVLLNGIALDLFYDRVLSHRQLCEGGDRLEQAWSQGGGILPLNPLDMHKAFPTLFGSPRAAQKALCNSRFYTQTSNKKKRFRPIWTLGIKSMVAAFGALCNHGIPPTVFRYTRPPGRGRPSTVLVDPVRHPDPRAAAEALLGPLASFDPATP